MAFILPEPVPLESFDKIDIDSFSCNMQTLQFSFVIAKYLRAQRVRTKTIDVPVAALMDYMTRPLAGETMYAAMKRMLWGYAESIGEIPPGAIDDETDETNETDETAGEVPAA